MEIRQLKYQIVIFLAQQGTPVQTSFQIHLQMAVRDPAYHYRQTAALSVPQRLVLITRQIENSQIIQIPPTIEGNYVIQFILIFHPVKIKCLYINNYKYI